ncbi:MAG: serine/threonine-protein kinase, partial [Planctomycetota bacterium]
MSILLTCTHCGHVQPLNFTPPAGSTVYCQRCGAPQSANVAAGASGARAAAPDDEPPSAVLPPLPGGYRAYGARVEVPAEHGAAARPAPAPAPSPAQAQAEGATTASGAVRQAGVSPTPQTLKVAMEVPPGEPSGLPGRSDAFPETGAETESGYGSSPDALAGGRQPDLRPLRPPLTVAPPVHDGLQDYALEDVLGRGGMGVVYRAVEMHLNRPVALKMMNPSGREEPGEWEAASQRFEQEAMVTGKLQHPGIVPVYQLDRAADGTPFYTMRPIEGRSLRDILQALLSEDPATQTEFPLIRLVRVLAEACRAVAYAHDERVIHRDLKPGNIMVGKYGEVLVIDWGLAKCMDGLGPESI